jgi:hypothetical protein
MKLERYVYRIVERKSGAVCGVYSRACHDEFDFATPESARWANCHGIHQDKERFRIAKIRVTEELVDDDCDRAAE